MGIYARAYSGKLNNTIPGNKKKEFTKRIEKLFQAGGMMMVKPNILFGKKFSRFIKKNEKEWNVFQL